MGTPSLVTPWTSLDVTLTQQLLVLLAQESMSQAAAAPASLDEDNPTFTFTSSAAVEQTTSVSKPTSPEHDAQRNSKILTPVLLHLQFGAPLHSVDNQPVEEHRDRAFVVFGLGLNDSGRASTELL